MLDVLRLFDRAMHPVGLFWTVMIVAGIACIRRGRRRLGVGLLMIPASMTLAIQPWGLTLALERIERPWRDKTLREAPEADAVVVLGGGWQFGWSEFSGLDFVACVDRLLTGVELCRLKRAPVLLLGGDPPDQPPDHPAPSASISAMLANWGVKPSEVLSLGPVRSTRDEAVQTAGIVAARGWKRVLLVTSAFHMERALGAFKAAGVSCHPVACDFQTARKAPDYSLRRLRIIPEHGDVASLTLLWHEILGSLAYRLSGSG